MLRLGKSAPRDCVLSMQDEKASWIPLSSAELSAEVNPLGAQLSVLRDAEGRELLWNGDPAVWAGRSPLLFPIVGTLAGGSYRLGSKAYPLPRHGFARGRQFDVAAASSSSATFRLKADEASVQVYPFRFQLDVDFALDGATLSVTSSVRNTGEEDMPASIGYHPGFRWPLPYGESRAAHFIEFADDEGPSIRRLGADGLLSPERHPTPVSHRRLALDDALFRDDVVIFDEIRSRSVSYGADNGPRIRVSYPDALYLGVWTKPGAPFICIEPWQGIADEAGFSGDFRTKLGVFTLAPGAAQSLTMHISLLR
ncbi:MAG: Aldose 1-epimerase [Gammaproteobacteria bacterium]|jgi:galactose mutarotase-like enzyme|nr:Aldose 1-epimerase [Gammaproteobacteria bacterium]